MTNKEALTKLRMAHLETEDNDLKEALLMGIRAIKQLNDIFPEICPKCCSASTCAGRCLNCGTKMDKEEEE